MIRARFVKDTENFQLIAFLAIAALPRPDDLVVPTNENGTKNYQVSWINFMPQANEFDVSIGCKEFTPNQTPEKSYIDSAELKERMRSVVDLQGRMWEKAQSYSNVIMLAGYAGIFAIWSLVKDKLSPCETGIIAILLGISLILYISFELYSMILRSLYAKGALNVMSTDPTKYFEALAEFEEKVRRSAATLSKVWVWVLPPTIFSGYAAAIYMMYAVATRMLF